jgi:hypothetical protein
LYSIAVIYDYLSKRLIFQKNTEGKQIFYNMRNLTKEGLNLKDHEPMIASKQFLEKNKIIHAGAQPNQKVFYCNEGYGLVKYMTDRFGFRNKDSTWDQINDDKKNKALFIGDSFVNGACVHDRDVISNLVQDSENDLLSFNLGMAGNTSIMNAYTIKLFLNKIKPKYLIIGIHPNDRENFPTNKYFAEQIENPNLVENYFSKDKSKLKISEKILIDINIKKKKIIDQQDYFFSNNKTIIMRAIPYLKLSNIRKQFLFLKEKYFFKFDKDTIELINLANQECMIHKCKIIFMYFPASKYWTNDQNQFIFKNNLKKYIEKYNHTFIDFSEIIKFDDKTFYAIKGGHYSPSTYKIISNKILENLN